MTLRQRVLARLYEGRPDLAFDEACEAASNGTARERCYAPMLIHDLAGRVPIAAWTRQRAARAPDHPGPANASEPGRVAFPAVPPLGWHAGRFVTATARPALVDSIPLSGEAEAACRDALEAARAALGSQERFELTFDHVDFEGSSCGLAVALAAVSVVRRVPIDPLLAATGRVRPDGHVAPVGSVEEKLRLSAEARPRGLLLVPGASGALGWRATSVDSLGAALAACTLPDGGLDDLVDEFHKLDRAGDWLAAARLARRLADAHGLDDETRVKALAVRLAAANHDADAVAATEVGDEIATCLDLGVSDVVLARAIGSLAVRSIDRADTASAGEVLDLAKGRAWQAPARIHLDGTEALLRVLEGRIDQAVALRRGNVEAAARSAELPRCLGDLADTLWRSGALDEAADTLARAFVALDEIPTQKAYLARTRAFLHLHGARIQRLRGEPDAARKHLGGAFALPGVDPRLRLRLEAAHLEEDAAQVEEAMRGLRGVAVLDALADRTLAILGDTGAEDRLRAFLRAPDASLDVLSRRLPY